jgi:hypothetical protein
MAEPQRFILGVAYTPGRDPHITKGLDGTRDYFTADELEKAAWTFLKGGAQVGLFHSRDPAVASGHFEVTETYIYRGPDWTVGDQVIKAGTWLIGGIADEVAWGIAQRGEAAGFSPDGVAKRRKPARPT